MDKKGQIGLDTAKSVMLALLVLGVVAFAIIILVASLSNSDVAQTSGGGTIANETVTTLEGDNTLTADGFSDCSASIILVINSTGGEVVGSGNYTSSGCVISGIAGASGNYNSSSVDVTYSFTYNEFGFTEKNITNSVGDFFGNAGTWFSLLAVVVIILIIAIVIFAVNRLGGGGSGGSSKEASL